jgi:hypothetical protein
MMTKTEREALTSLVKQRFKLLRHDIDVRKTEMIAELSVQLDRQFAAGEKAWNDALFLIGQARDECNRAVNTIMRGFTESIGEEWPVTHDVDMVVVQGYSPPFQRQRHTARKQALADIDAMEARARHELARQENALLTDLLTGALQSADAQAFMARIPQVSDLMVPAARIAEIVGPMDGGTTDA